MNAELMRKRPAVVVSMTIEGTARPTEPEHHAPRTPADWPARLWVPLLCSPGLLLAALLIGLVRGLT